MQYRLDLHIHSRYSRAVSKNMTLPVMDAYARRKGIDILSTADFTHPLWLQELKDQLIEKEGLYVLNSFTKGAKDIYYILGTEIACIYKQEGKVRRIHNLIFVPDFEVADNVRKVLFGHGANLSSDGRPIIGLSAKQLLEIILEIDERSFLIPAHVWTPHFGVYGSASGFDSLQKCFEDLTPYIYGIETGLSSDPSMNWRVKELEYRSILSFSDAHSPMKMGREATVMELMKPTFETIKHAIMQKGNANRIAYTIEFYPEEGKYHFSGHRNCQVSIAPGQITSEGNICLVCHKKLTEGVLFRVQELSDLSDSSASKISNEGILETSDSTKKHPPFLRLVPLLEVIAQVERVTTGSKKVLMLYERLCHALTSELNILLHEPLESIATVGGMRLAEGIGKVRKGDIHIEPGFDGEYGKVWIWPDKN